MLQKLTTYLAVLNLYCLRFGCEHVTRGQQKQQRTLPNAIFYPFLVSLNSAQLSCRQKVEHKAKYSRKLLRLNGERIVLNERSQF